MSLSFRSVLPGSLPVTVLATLPRCANPFCLRPPSLWQRWWARHEGTWLEENWYCSPDCFYDGLCTCLENAAALTLRRTPRPNRLPLGLVLLSRQEITAEQLRQALAMQRSTGGGKVGEWLVRMGAISEEQVTSALAAQQGCAVFAAREPQSLPATMHWPRPLTEAFRAAPVFYNPAQSNLYVGFLEGVDHSFLYSVERMLQCRTEPCILPPSVFQRNRERYVAPWESETIVIHERQNLFEMAQTVGNYAHQVQAERCAVTSSAGHVWIRLRCSTGFHVDFLFRSPAAQ